MLPRIHLVLAFFLLSIAILKTTGSNAQCTVRAVSTPASCSGQSDGSISLQVTGTPPYKFEWSNGANTQNITSLTAGNYKVKVIDAKGAIATTNTEVKIQANFDLKITLTDTNLNSLGKDLTVTTIGGKAPYQYFLTNLSNINNPTSIEQKNEVFSNLAAGRYAIAVTDASGCSVVKGITIKKTN